MEFIDESTPFEDSEWRIAGSVMPAFTLHVVYRQREEVLCFGIKAATLDPVPVREMIAVVEAQCRQGGFVGSHGIVPAHVLAFDALGHLSGGHRRLAKGWANELDSRVVQVFPCFQCELAGDWPAVRFDATIRSFDVFDFARRSSPFAEIKVRGGKSQLLIENWSTRPLPGVLTYAVILSAEPEGVLQIRNLWGEVVEFGPGCGWEDYAQRISAHVSQRKAS